MAKPLVLQLDDDFIHYCTLNEIEDVEAYAARLFKEAFTLLKYGSSPPLSTPLPTQVPAAGEFPKRGGDPLVRTPKTIKKPTKDIYGD